MSSIRRGNIGAYLFDLNVRDRYRLPFIDTL